MCLLLELHDLILKGEIVGLRLGAYAGFGEFFGVVWSGRAVVFDGCGNGEQELAVVQHR